MRIQRLGAASAVVVGLLLASAAEAHDFWLIPNLFAFASDSIVSVDGKSGTRFPSGSAVQPARVAEAWVIGATSRTRINELSIVDSSLRLQHRPESPGQYLVAMALTPRLSRSTPAGLLRFLNLEGGVSEAARLERENVLAGHDSVVFNSASYAATAVQVGRSGPRAFSATAGFPLEFVPLNDPARLRVGDTLHLKVLGSGKAVADIGIDARNVADTAETPSPWTTITADANGVAHLALPKGGPWLIRSAWVARRPGGAPNEWDVARSTYVFGVSPRR